MAARRLLNHDSCENLMDLREMTEVGMMRLAIDHHSEEELQELEELLEEMERAVETEDDPVETFFKADETFHDKIAEMGKNPMADKINRVVRSLTYNMRFRTVSIMIREGRAAELIETHRQLMEAIREKDTHDLSNKVRFSYYEEELADEKGQNA